MKINWKIRLRNKAWLAAVLATLVTFAFDLLALFDVTPAVTEAHVTQAVTAILTLLTALGVVMDPTTEGVEDSPRAMTYE